MTKNKKILLIKQIKCNINYYVANLVDIYTVVASSEVK
jgi:hypothetical protein